MYCGDSQIGILRIITIVFFLTLPYIYIVKKLLSIELFFSGYHRNGCKYYSQLICHRVEIGRTVKKPTNFYIDTYH